jgi:hypothetical protein
MIATLLSFKAGFAVTPLIVVSVVVAYISTEVLSAYAEGRLRRGEEGKQSEMPATGASVAT